MDIDSTTSIEMETECPTPTTPTATTTPTSKPTSTREPQQKFNKRSTKYEDHTKEFFNDEKPKQRPKFRGPDTGFRVYAIGPNIPTDEDRLQRIFGPRADVRILPKEHKRPTVADDEVELMIS
eukprot:TRINITY_DN85_c0_g2_i1.p1 TRINITY_DN85_c0_g2~~TRINITY_DN85_c0_g2_i1.p1  ORF type:complete len:123 (+),score=11.19 TRINITY_DN85_c0_g2_i1:180-548(+)